MDIKKGINIIQLSLFMLLSCATTGLVASQHTHIQKTGPKSYTITTYHYKPSPNDQRMSNIEAKVMLNDSNGLEDMRKNGGISGKDSEGKNVYHYMCDSDKPKLVEWLYFQNSYTRGLIRNTDNYKKLPSYYAAKSGNKSLYNFLKWKEKHLD